MTLACTTAQEKKAYADSEPHFLATERIRALDVQVGLHFVLGERSDVVCVPARFHAPRTYLRDATDSRFGACTGRSTATTPFWNFGRLLLCSGSGALGTLYVFLVALVS